ncbi:ORF97 [black bullhead herpesvirus]|uniref:ORF97 n=1 Tax=black bullhead herpesvirus TaxID=508441 RepID=A0A2H5AJF3_9VIRU|nr:ORF97 [black bullhead herpesvirus]AUG72285.1 ORF97 [black bullhead herpesvirus]
MGSIEPIVTLLALRETGYECDKLHETLAIEAEKFGIECLETLDQKIGQKLESAFPGCDTEEFFRICGDYTITPNKVKKAEGQCAVAGLVNSGLMGFSLTPIPTSKTRATLFQPINWAKVKSELTWKTLGRKRLGPGDGQTSQRTTRTEVLVEATIVAPLMMLYNELSLELLTLDLSIIKCIYQ